MLTCSVVIPTRNRVEPLRECLASIACQTRVPSEVLLVDASDDSSVTNLAASLADGFSCPVHYVRAKAKSLVIQRWQGVQAAKGDLVFFFDDDVVLEPEYNSEVAGVFESDIAGEVGGVAGLINGGWAGSPSRFNSSVLRAFGGPKQGSYAGRVVGPAVNFYDAPTPDGLHIVEWLPGCAMAYRRQALLAEPCWESFRGYSFMEDVHLSVRVGRRFRLLSTTRARLVHKGLGMSSPNWTEMGESMVLNRHATMVVLDRRHFRDYVRLVAYELIYCTAAQIKSGSLGWRAQARILLGRLRGFCKLALGRSPHRRYFSSAPASRSNSHLKDSLPRREEGQAMVGRATRGADRPL